MNFGKRSNDNLSYCHNDMIKIHTTWINITLIDYGINYGHRSPEIQFELFKKGRSFINDVWVITDKLKVVTNCDGYTIKGKHNYNPSIATDFYAYIPGQNKLSYDELHLTYIACGLQTTARFLYEAGEIEHLIRWGGNWDNDGIIKYDQRLQDLCHVELYKP